MSLFIEAQNTNIQIAGSLHVTIYVFTAQNSTRDQDSFTIDVVFSFFKQVFRTATQTILKNNKLFQHYSITAYVHKGGKTSCLLQLYRLLYNPQDCNLLIPTMHNLSQKCQNLESYLDSGLSELCSQSQLFSYIDIGVVSFLKYFLQFLQLQTSESCSVSPLLTAGDIAVTLITKFIQVPLLLQPFHWRHPEIVAIVHGPAQLCVKRLSFHFSNPVVHCIQGGLTAGQ